jgi:para-nitrobenzyl esterase
MNKRRIWRALSPVLTVALAGLVVLTQGGNAVADTSSATRAPIVKTEGGSIRGLDVNGSIAYRGIPYAAPPVGELRWRPPQPAAKWTGVRDGSQFGPSSPQQRTPLTNVGGPLSEDSLYLNVSTPSVAGSDRPVIVWFHGGGHGLGAGRDYEPAKLTAKGAVVVTVNYRLGALGFLAHPALAEYPGGPSGNYGLMDQQAALRWVQKNIDRFGGDRRNVTIAGQSSGGLSVLVHLTSPGSQGLFQKAILQSGAFALEQESHAAAEAASQAFVEKLGITDQTAERLRSIPVDDLVNSFPTAIIPGYVDGKVLQRPVGEALAAGQFARVPILQGTDHDEEAVFLTIGLAVSQGRFVPATGITAENYQEKIAAVLGVSGERAAEVAAEYPLSSYASATQALSVVVGDASFVAGAAQVNTWVSGLVPAFLYEFNDDAAPLRYPPPLNPPVATHGSELTYVFDLPDAPYQGALSAGQETLADSIRAAWASFAATGNPSTKALPWPTAGATLQAMSLEAPQPRLSSDYADRHHVEFWLQR